MMALQAKWDEVYRNISTDSSPAEVLANNRHLLPIEGNALDLACGLGGNALLLAEHGLTTEAWDVSPLALAHLQSRAEQKRLKIHSRQYLIRPESLLPNRFDVIVVSRFLDRSLCDAIMAALKPAGLLFYQTFTRYKLDPQGPKNPDYLLDSNELLELFAPLRVVFYQEYGRLGQVRYGNRNEACFIGQKTLPTET